MHNHEKCEIQFNIEANSTYIRTFSFRSKFESLILSHTSFGTESNVVTLLNPIRS